MRMTEEQLKAYQKRTTRPSSSPEPEGFVLADNGKWRFKRSVSGGGCRPRPKHQNGTMNEGEKAYARYLDTLLTSGEIAGWWYELVTLKLADRCGLQPDFMVMRNDGAIELHEVKGGKSTDGGKWTYWAEEDAKIKLKIAATIIPFPLFVVWPQRGGHQYGWCYERMKSD